MSPAGVRRRARGAALIVSIGVLTLLLVVALTFFRASREEVRTADNSVNSIRAEMLADGATAVAIAFLQHDLRAHPSITSTDHAWRTYFNGAWAVGKPWMWAPLDDPALPANDPNRRHPVSPIRGGVPRVQWEDTFDDTNPNRTRDILYIPRVDFPNTFDTSVQNQGNPFRPVQNPESSFDDIINPFVTTTDVAEPGTAEFSGVADLLLARLSAVPPFDQINFIGPGGALRATVFDDVAPDGRVIKLFNDLDPIDNRDMTLPKEQVHFWTDVDNDGDGLRDSMWLPVGADRFFPNDGLDNDLDGFRDAVGADGEENTGDDDRDGEPAIFMYRGNVDGLDNDGDGEIDEDDEARFVIFTVPFPWVLNDDSDANTQPIGNDDIIEPTTAELRAMGIQAGDIVIYDGRKSIDPDLFDQPIGSNANGDPVFTRDDNLDLVANDLTDASNWMIRGAVEFVRRQDTGELDNALEWPYTNLLNTLTNFQDDGVLDTGDFRLRPGARISAEPLTELAGRMAILITDEASKVNLNAAGGYNFIANRAFADSDGNVVDASGAPMTRAFSEGAGPEEYEVRVLDEVGGPRANRLWNFRMGATRDSDSPPSPTVRPGDGLSSGAFASMFYPFDALDPDLGPTPQSENFTNPVLPLPEFMQDVSLPGYAFVDDNGNLLELALNGIDDDGDAEYYQNDGIDNDLNGLIDDPGEGLRVGVDEGLFAFDYTGDGIREFANLEGIDEPGEYRRFRPSRNFVAEMDGDDNDFDDVIDEIGEFADHRYRTERQVTQVRDFGPVRLEAFRRDITVNSVDRNDSYFHRDNVIGSFLGAPSRTATGLRKNLNLSRVTGASSVARAVRNNWTYPVSRPRVHALSASNFGERAIAGGSDALVTLRPTRPDPLEQSVVDAALTGAELFAAGLRQANTTVLSRQALLGLPFPEPLDPQIPSDGAIALRADEQLRAHQVAATIKDYADPDYTRSLDDDLRQNDDWWSEIADALEFITFSNNDPGDDGTLTNVSTARDMYYSVAGMEAVRINEISVRPIRRIEAESQTLAARESGLNPNRFVRSDISLTEQEEEGFRVRTRTTSEEINFVLADRINRLPKLTALGTNDVFFNAGATWDLQTPGFPNFTDSLLGLESAWVTYESYFAMEAVDIEGNVLQRFEVPDVVQFSFQPTLELPPGRYYLTVNTQLVDADTGAIGDTVVDPADFAFATKISTLNDDLFTDLVNIDDLATEDVNTDVWRTPIALGREGLGGSEGMAFVQGGSTFRNLNNVFEGYNAYGGFDANLGFTIEVPEPVGGGFADPASDPWLHIGFRRIDTSDQPRPFAVNFFDFSREPDHEWVELVNLDEENPVNISGWQLAVENHPLGFGPMTVPSGTVIAPGGMVLLGTNTFDSVNHFQATGFDNNGVGLASSGNDGVTVPQVLGDDNPFLETEDQARIVELDVPGLRPRQALGRLTPGEIAAIVLGGGIFPNRPEYDGVDNDGDNGQLARDGIDNDGDGFVDVLGLNGINEPNNNFVDDDPFEGIDEGRARREFRRLEGVGSRVTAVPGSFHGESVPFNLAFPNPLFPGTFQILQIDPAVDFDLFPYLDKAQNPPEWMEFVERRNFPGDNVIVTLYQGPARNGQIVDRVTYTQRDVDNRAIDDVLLVSDVDPVNGEESVADTTPGVDPVPFPLAPAFQAHWPENTMGIDFDKPLERKHEYYTGDRFGTRNRFQVTDGNYDDWAPATSRWERSYLFDGAGNVTGVGGILDRLAATGVLYNTFASGLRGTPLRRNTAAILADTHNDPNLDITRVGVDASAQADLARFRNRNLTSPGDALRMPHTSLRQEFDTLLDGGTFYMVDRASPNVSFWDGVGDLLTNPPARGNRTYEQFLLGQRLDRLPQTDTDFFKDIRAFLGDIGTTDSSSLSVAQARPILFSQPFNPVWDERRDSENNLVGLQPPSAWSPMLLWEVAEADDSNDPFNEPPASITNVTAPPVEPLYPEYDELRYLFALDRFAANVQAPFALPQRNRWRARNREALYASSNDAFTTTDMLNGLGAEAMFVWDGDDGLEDGEYDVFLVVNEDMNELVNAQILAQGAGGLPILTDEGAAFINTQQQTPKNDILLDVEVLTDLNNDRRVWTEEPGAGVFAGSPSAVLDGTESFGLLPAAQPGADGVIHYGQVSVRNNFLAMFLRNRTTPGRSVSFSRIVLAARNKTPGRININTVETRRRDNGNPNLPETYFNPIEGLPGIIVRQADDSDASSRFVSLPSSIDITGNDTPLNPDDDFTGDRETQLLVRQIVQQRKRLGDDFSHVDGRYYELTADLLNEDHFAEILMNNEGSQTVRPPLVANDNSEPIDSGVDGFVSPIDSIERAQAIEESAFRFGKMQNLITTRTDVFEILVTVQTGYGVDVNGDGVINWRDPNEFVSTAEKQSRTIYER